MNQLPDKQHSCSAGFQPVPGGAQLHASARVENPCYRTVLQALALLVPLLFFTGAQRTTSPSTVQFRSVDIFIDPHNQPLAAYQIEFTGESDAVKLVGIEGGSHPAFKDPPYYDPRAMMQNRVILAALNAGDDLPKAPTRVARLHLQITGEHPKFEARLIVAARGDGEKIPADVSIEEGEKP